MSAAACGYNRGGLIPGPVTTIGLPRELVAEVVEALGGVGLASPEARLSDRVIAQHRDLARRVGDVVLGVDE